MSNVYREYQHLKRTPEFNKWKHRQYLKQGGLCWYCGIFLKGVKINVEHKTAISLGGRNNKSNMVLSCSTCNKDKGSRILSPEEREKYNKQNKSNKGTYKKNLENWEVNVRPYTDEGFYEMIRYF